MKYINYFKENNNIDNHKNDVDKIFENDNWLIIRPKSFEALLYWSEGTDWRIENINSKYHITSGFAPKKYKMNDSIYVNVDKKNSEKYLFDFDVDNFYDKDGNDIWLYDFLDNNNDLFNIYGEIIQSYNVVKENNEYWLVVPDYSFFDNYFKVDNNYRSDLIKSILSEDSSNIFSYSYRDFDINDVNIKLDDDNVYLLMSILILEKFYNENYDYSLDDIKNYDDIADIVSNYDIEEFEKLLLSIICESTESADNDAAFYDVLSDICDFFNILKDTIIWKNYKNNINDYLWIKFKTNKDAYRAKFLFNNYNNEWDDDKIDYSPPYNGYSYDTKNFNNIVNDILYDKVYDYSSNSFSTNDIFELYDYINNIKKNNNKISNKELISDIDIYLNTKKYNL